MNVKVRDWLDMSDDEKMKKLKEAANRKRAAK